MLIRRVDIFGAILCVVMVLCFRFVSAGQYTVIFDEKNTYAGSEFVFTLIFLQDSAEDQARFPKEILCELTQENNQIKSILAKQISNNNALNKPNAKTYIKRQYVLRLPTDMGGRVIIKLTTVDVPSFVFFANKTKTKETLASTTTYPTMDSLFTLYQPYIKNVSAYKPMYFLVGTDPENSKFQISFKYRFIDPTTTFSERYPWVSGLHFAYTQTSYWDLKSDSAPFADSSYKPELFWLSNNFLSSSTGVFKGLFFQGGLQHESNGRGGDSSRSTNYLYAQPIFIFYSKENRLGLQFSPKFWAYVNNDETTNPDLMDYRGYFELEAKAGFADSLVLGSTFRWADEGASIQLDLSYPLHTFFNGALDVYFHAQYTNMLAEQLLDYTERSNVFRIGLSIVR